MNGSRALEKGMAGLALVAALASCGGGTYPNTYPSLYLTTSVWGPTGGVYDGPAVVERSTADELVLAFDADPNGGGTLPRHLSVRQLGPTLFPVGAKVWLEKDPAVLSPQRTSFSAPVTESFSVSTKKGGTLLFGATIAPSAAELTAAGVVALDRTTTTSQRYVDECVRGTLERSTFAVGGDAPVAVADGETRVVRLGGVDYDVALVARTINAVSTVCADAGGFSSFAISVRARDLAGLAATLDAGQPPACARGNAVYEDVAMTLYNVTTGTELDGRVFYKKSRADLAGYDCYQFDVEGLTATGGSEPPVFEACFRTGRFAEPTIGQELWATLPALGIAALWQANRGPLIAATVVPITDVDNGIATDLLGIDIDVRPGCDYASYNKQSGEIAIHQLQEAVFGTQAPIIIGADGQGVVSIDGADYDAWVSEGGSFSLLAR